MLIMALLAAPAMLALVTFLLGFRVGGDHWMSELARVRSEAAHAERRLHELTRQAFIAMAEHVQQDRRADP